MEASVQRPDPTQGQSAGNATWTPADPGPLGLAGFALTTFILSMFNAHLVNGGDSAVVLSVALAYGGIAQFAAGMWEFRTGNTFGAVAFSSYGAFWISFFILSQFHAKLLVTPGKAVGLYLIAWGIFTTYMWVASFRTSVAVNLVFLFLAITFFLLGIGQSGNHVNIIKAGGWCGLVTAAVAWYTSFAAVTNSTFGRTIIPVVPLTPGARAK
jgi:uncharacterized protein